MTFLDFIDGELEWAGPTVAEGATRIVRHERPDIIVTHDPYAGAPGYRVPQLHPDHRAVGSVVVDACYFRAPATLGELDDALKDRRSMRTALLAIAACRCDGNCPILERALAAMTSFACHLGAFDAAELQRYGQHRQAIRAATQEIKELTDGCGLHLGTAPETFLKAAEWVVLEHRCCPFLSFKLEFINESNIWLSVTGPDGVKAFLGEALSSRAQRLPGA